MRARGWVRLGLPNHQIDSMSCDPSALLFSGQIRNGAQDSDARERESRLGQEIGRREDAFEASGRGQCPSSPSSFSFFDL